MSGAAASPRSWRAREADTFRLLLDIMGGRCQPRPSWADDEWRRAGYLATAARLLFASRKAVDIEEAARRRLAAIGTPDLLPLIPGAEPKRSAGNAIAEAWGIGPGLDVGRFRAERQALELMMAHERAPS